MKKTSGTSGAATRGKKPITNWVVPGAKKQIKKSVAKKKNANVNAFAAMMMDSDSDSD